MSLSNPAVEPAPPVRAARTSFGISVAATAAEAIDNRVLEICTSLGLPMTRSTYFELLARYDREHKLIEQILAAPR